MRRAQAEAAASRAQHSTSVLELQEGPGPKDRSTVRTQESEAASPEHVDSELVETAEPDAGKDWTQCNRKGLCQRGPWRTRTTPYAPKHC